MSADIRIVECHSGCEYIVTSIEFKREAIDDSRNVNYLANRWIDCSI